MLHPEQSLNFAFLEKGIEQKFSDRYRKELDPVVD
jgi:hypothetical protein